VAQGRRFTSGRTFGSSRRQTSWNAGPAQSGTSITAAGTLLWATGSQAAEDGLTVVRLRGELTMFVEVATSPFDGFLSIGHGICIVSENAFNAGTASVPAPLDDIGWDGWIWYHLTEQLREASTTETGRSGLSMVRIPIDSKAMRKNKRTDVLVGVSQFGTEVGTSTLTFSSRTRVLDKIA